jgi:predicted dithiol-disulfide oxidoreductase (DUF899 family)
MYGPERERPCPGCTHMLDSLDGVARHASQGINLFIVAKSPLARLLAFARERGWVHLTFLSTSGNTYDRDYILVIMTDDVGVWNGSAYKSISTPMT